MNAPETATATKPSLAQDWLNALRYWLRGRNGVIVLLVLAVVIGAALNWSWLVAVGIAPLLITVLPCAAMCALGLCMNKMAGGSCSTETRSPKPDARVVASLEAGEPRPAPLLTDTSTLPGEPTAGSAISVTEPAKPEERS
ncbi:MAG: hypothetical protein ACREJ5_24445 [Geminicoccaceae bacterium]